MNRVFRPRRGRLVPVAVAAVALIAFTVVALLLSGEGRTGAGWLDRVLLIGTGALLAFGLLRLASVRVETDPDGLTVVNLVRRRRLTWPEVLAVRLADGDPWVQLDLADGSSLAAMGIQGADGAYALDQARALAALVAAHQ